VSQVHLLAGLDRQCRHIPNWKRERELHARPSGYEPDEVLFFYPAKMVPREVLAPSSLPFQGSARTVSAIEAWMVPRPRFERGRRAFSTLEVCQFPSSRHKVGACPRIRTEKNDYFE
jgi:hypothetical protein